MRQDSDTFTAELPGLGRVSWSILFLNPASGRWKAAPRAVLADSMEDSMEAMGRVARGWRCQAARVDLVADSGQARTIWTWTPREGWKAAA